MFVEKAKVSVDPASRALNSVLQSSAESSSVKEEFAEDPHISDAGDESNDYGDIQNGADNENTGVPDDRKVRSHLSIKSYLQ